MTRLALVLALSLTATVSAFAVSEIRTYVISCGALEGASADGGTLDNHWMRGTLGQDVIGVTTSSQHTIYAGFWHSESPTVPVLEAPPFSKPFHVYQNDPNPFNPRTTIRYDVAASGGDVRLTVHGVDGRRVRTLVNGDQSPGHKTVDWDGRDDFGRPTASGLYFYTLVAPDYRQTRKMLLLR